MTVVAGLTVLAPATPAAAVGPCDAPVTNPIPCENSQPGSPRSEWDLSCDAGLGSVCGSGSDQIQGFATDASYAQGQTAVFKIKTTATAYRLDIYRMGYYAGDGARKIATVDPTASLPQSQPACLTDATTGLYDCGNWAASASWAIPTTAVSGIYFAKLVRTDGTAGNSHIVFVVRDDNGAAPILLQTSDTTWQAYNQYGGHSFYYPSASPGVKSSYNRPYDTRTYHRADWVFNAEYPMVRFLEANGYDLSYATGVDTERSGAELLEHQVFLTAGHDEYWSAGQRANVEAARDAGVHLALFTGNDSFWKTRWENSTSSPSTAYRTLVTYKESKYNPPDVDPATAWTGTWRDPRCQAGSDCGRPENGLSGTLFTINGPQSQSITVPQADGLLRLWRGTAAATLGSGQVATLPVGTLGYEWNEDVDNGFRPAGLVDLSTTVVANVPKIQDYCCTYASGTATHRLTMYRDTNGAGPDALVFSAGTVQWSWGLDGNHDSFDNRVNAAPDATMQQATINLLADMGVQPGSIAFGLSPATASTDTVAPTAAITSPASGASVPVGGVVTISGSAVDSGGGRVGAVEVSVDGGATWHPAQGRESWTYSWIPGAIGTATIAVRAADDSANLGAVATRQVSVASQPLTFVGATSNRVASGTGSLAVPVPSGTQAGDLLLIASAHRIDCTVTLIDNGTLVGDFAGGGTAGYAATITVYRVVATNGLTSLGLSGTCAKKSGVIYALRGADTTNPVETSSQAAATGTGLTLPGVTTTTAGDQLVAFLGAVNQSTAGTFNPAAPLTERADTSSLSSDTAVADETRPTAGATGNRSASYTISTQKAGVLLAIRPAAGGGSTNQAPSANAGPDQTVSGGATVALAGSGTDPEGGAVTYSWSQTAGPAVTLSSTTTASPTFTAPSTDTTLTFHLVVTDNLGATGADDVQITVQSSPPPQGITFVGATSNRVASGTGSLAVPVPSGTQAGDLLLIASAHRIDCTVTLIDNGTLVGDFAGGGTAGYAATITVYRVVATNGLTSLGLSGTCAKKSGVIYALRGADTTNPVETSSQAAATGTGLTLPGVTTTTAGDQLVAFLGAVNQSKIGSFTAPATMTMQADTSSVSSDTAVADETRPTAGATGTRSFTYGISTQKAGVLLAIRPAV